jgi:lipopolysaccharide cholinephosphotransferase
MLELYRTQELRELQLSEVELLVEFDRVCKELGLRYYLMSGTLLGAVRHSGFIPWDDDLDVVMPRWDYEQLMNEGQKILSGKYFLQNTDSDPEYPNVYAKLRNSETAFIEEVVSKRGMNHGIFIDIFPLDGIPKSRLLRNFLWTIKLVIGKSCLIKSDLVLEETAQIRLVKKFLQIVPLSDRALRKIYINLCKVVESDRTDYLILSTWPVVPQKVITFKKEWFEKSKPVCFEDGIFPAPFDYDSLLRQLYGDYLQLPAIEKRVAHHVTVAISTTKSYRDLL